MYAEGGEQRLYRLNADGSLQTLALPFRGSIGELSTDAREPGAVLGLESWVHPGAIFSASGSTVRDLALVPPFSADLSQLTSEVVEATAADGTRIPVDVIRQKGYRRDGSATMLVDAYGSYGRSLDPVFHPEVAAFVMRGGVYAEAHVRGGGEFGESWHLAGKGATKPNTWRDFIASIQALEKAGYTSPGKVAGMGVSAGGIMIGRAITERPDLLAAAVMWAPIANTLRFETTEGGPANVAEFGTIKTPEGYRALREMDPYSHVVDGTDYPAVLITGGMNDHRVPVWMPAEMAARLRAASASRKPVRLRIDFAGGHHMMGAAKADQIEQATDTFAFVFGHTGNRDFQPTSPTAGEAAR